MTLPNFDEFLATLNLNNNDAQDTVSNVEDSKATSFERAISKLGEDTAQKISESMLKILESYHQWLSQYLENK